MNLQNFLNFSFVIEGGLDGLSFPFHSGHVPEIIDFLCENRISCLVILTEYGYRLKDTDRIETLQFPVPDFDVPSLEQMDKIWN